VWLLFLLLPALNQPPSVQTQPMKPAASAFAPAPSVDVTALVNEILGEKGECVLGIVCVDYNRLFRPLAAQ
jgi:hypothetical protein